MLTTPKDILMAFPERKTREQRQAFRDAVQAYAELLGYDCRTENGDILVIGDASSASYLLSAGNSDSGILVLLEILRVLPENRRSRVCFLLFDDPLFGAYSYRKRHPETENQLVICLEEVGQGNKLRMFSTKKLNAERRKLTSLYKACGYFGKKSLLVQEKNCLPWYIPFPYAVHLCSVQSGKKETYRNRSRHSTTVDETNINILRAALTSLFCCDAAQ